jgi:hypothetical protein
MSHPLVAKWSATHLRIQTWLQLNSSDLITTAGRLPLSIAVMFCRFILCTTPILMNLFTVYHIFVWAVVKSHYNPPVMPFFYLRFERMFCDNYHFHVLQPKSCWIGALFENWKIGQIINLFSNTPFIHLNGN